MAAIKVKIIFLFTSIISSTVRKIVHPNILAIEITYLALFSLSSGSSPRKLLLKIEHDYHPRSALGL